MAIHKVVDVIAMRRCLVAAVRTMVVPLLMRAAVVVRCAAGWVGCADQNRVFVHMIAVCVVQVAIVKIVRVAIMVHGSVATFLAVFVAVLTFVFSVSSAHCLSAFFLN